jgi:omega-hydroxy-beta-dihydromenaquinone-9 sulfotransferase
LMSKDKRFAFCHTDECLGPHTIFTFGRVLRFILKRALPKTRPMDNMALGAMLPKEEEFAIGNMGVESMAHALYFPKKFSEHFNRFVLFSGDTKEKINWKNNHLFLLKKLTLKNKGKRMLLKSPFDTGRVKEILELYPDAKFIHIYRNPYAVYFSNVKLYEGVLPQTAFHRIGNHEMEQHVFYTYKATYKKFIAERPLIPRGNLFEISYEQFIGHEKENLENIYGMLNLGNFNDVLPEIQSELHKTKNYQINKYALPSEKENEVFENWQFAFDAFGYNKVLV